MRRLALAMLSGICLIPQLVHADVEQAIRDCTFEVLAQSPPTSTPSALVRIAGSAFCFGDDGELATAAHMFEPVLGGRFEVPYVRDREGRTYKVESIVRYSMPNDFVIFKVAGLPPRAARPHNTSNEIGTTLYLAWRERDGEIAFSSTQYRGRTSLAEFGRDGWIQFGPAPGHGASGAALFDDQGRVVGLINNRSSERADAVGYAVPIQVLENASTQQGELSRHDPMLILGMPSQRNVPLIGSIPLPASYAQFNEHMADVRRAYFARMLPYSLSLTGTDAPLSDAQRAGLAIALPTRTARYERGCQAAWSGVGAALVRCSADDALNSSRFAPPPPPPCRSEDGLDSATAVDSFTDDTGAQWQVRASAARGCDWIVISMSRALSTGTLTFVRGAPSAYREAAVMQLKALLNLGPAPQQVVIDVRELKNGVSVRASAPERFDRRIKLE